MPQYLVTARNASGRTVTELLESDCAKSAIQTLEDDGYESIILHTDDFCARGTEPLQLGPLLTAADLVKNRSRKALQRVLCASARAYLTLWELPALTVGAVAARRLMSKPWDFWDGLLLTGLMWPPFILAAKELPSMRYDRLVEADAWCRWDEVLLLLPRVRSKPPKWAAAWYEAKALAGLGQINDALTLVLPFATNGDIPEFKFWAVLVTSVYTAANLQELAMAAHEKALECAPDDAILLTDLAISVIDEPRDVERARELLQHAAKQPMSDVGSAFFAIAEGVIALEEGTAHLAIDRFTSAQLVLRKLARRNGHAGKSVDTLEGRLTLAKAYAGDLEAARKYFRCAEPRLRACRNIKLLNRCQQALGATDGR